MGTDERDAYIRAQYYTGRSAIELGAEQGVSRSQIHRIVAAGPPNGCPDDDGDLSLGDDEDSGGVDDLMPERMREPFAFVGLDTVTDYRGRPCKDSDGRLLGLAPRWRTANGHTIGLLDHWRYAEYLAHERDDPDGAERVRAEGQRQLAAAGVRCDKRGRWGYRTDAGDAGPMR